jgi:hypothetical protein
VALPWPQASGRSPWLYVGGAALLILLALAASKDKKKAKA